MGICQQYYFASFNFMAFAKVALMEYSISGIGLGKSFGKKVIFENLSFSFLPGAYCIYGANGRGKSTLLRILSGAERSFQGELKVCQVQAHQDFETANQYRSYLPDQPQFYPHATTRDLLSFVASVRQLEFESVMSEVFGSFELDSLLNHALDRQSLGQRKRSFLSATLLSKIPIWILDEPTNGLDAQFCAAFYEKVKKHVANQGTVIIATHDPELAKQLQAKSLHLFPYESSSPFSELRHE
jgi:ABC-type multidrug transport system ATPase subunit